MGYYVPEAEHLLGTGPGYQHDQQLSTRPLGRELLRPVQHHFDEEAML